MMAKRRTVSATGATLVPAAAKPAAINAGQAYDPDIRTAGPAHRRPTGDGGERIMHGTLRLIGRHLVHIDRAYRMARRDDPTAAPLVRFELRAARKRLGTRQRQARTIRFKGDVADLDGPESGVCLARLKACRKDMHGWQPKPFAGQSFGQGT